MVFSLFLFAAGSTIIVVSLASPVAGSTIMAASPFWPAGRIHKYSGFVVLFGGGVYHYGDFGDLAGRPGPPLRRRCIRGPPGPFLWPCLRSRRLAGSTIMAASFSHRRLVHHNGDADVLAAGPFPARWRFRCFRRRRVHQYGGFIALASRPFPPLWRRRCSHRRPGTPVWRYLFWPAAGFFHSGGFVLVAGGRVF